MSSEVEGYLPESRVKGPGVLVLHAWWGLNSFFKKFADRLTTQGFVAFAPDLYHGEVAESTDEAKRLRSKHGSARVVRDVEKASSYLRSVPRVRGGTMGIAGFSIGGYWAMQLADRRPDDFGAVVLFYGVRKGRRKADFSTHASFQGHFAEDDQYERLEMVRKIEEKIRASGREVAFHVYPQTKHWFMEDNQAGAYDPKAAAMAWKRTISFLHSKLDL